MELYGCMFESFFFLFFAFLQHFHSKMATTTCGSHFQLKILNILLRTIITHVTAYMHRCARSNHAEQALHDSIGQYFKSSRSVRLAARRCSVCAPLHAHPQWLVPSKPTATHDTTPHHAPQRHPHVFAFKTLRTSHSSFGSNFSPQGRGARTGSQGRGLQDGTPTWYLCTYM